LPITTDERGRGGSLTADLSAHLPDPSARRGARYRLYGLRVQADRPIPGLAPVEEEGGEPELRIWMGRVPEDVFAPDGAEEPWYVSPRMTPADDPTVVVHRRPDGAFRLRYADGCAYHVDAAAAHVACTWPAHFTVEDAATYLLGPVFGLVLRLRGVPSLHASAVGVDGVAVALVGPAGSGKSTTAAALAARGHALLADDVLALRRTGDAILAQPAYPHLRLWPDIVPTLLGPGAELPPLTPNWDKRGLRLDEAFHPHPLPLGAVYVLCGREAGADAPRLEPMGGMDAVLELVANAYVGWFPDRAAQARELEVLGRLARTVPAAWAIPSADPARLGALCTLIEADARGRRG
jgi:HPr Serine kinase C-terminal domain